MAVLRALLLVLAYIAAEGSEEGSRLQLVGHGCCRFDDYRAEARGVMSQATCGKLCLQDHHCIAMEVGPNHDQWNCFLMYGSGRNFHTACAEDARCYRKPPAPKPSPASLMEPTAEPQAVSTTVPKLSDEAAANQAMARWAKPALLKDESQEDLVLVATMSWGDPPTNFEMLFDTGSSDIWLPSRGCTGCPGAVYLSGSTLPTSTSTLTARLDGSNRVDGQLARESLHFASLVLPKQTLLLAQEVTMAPSHVAFDGVVGLAASELKDEPSFFAALAAAGVEPVFTFLPGREGAPARLLLGKEAFAPVIEANSLRWLPSISKRFWVVEGEVELLGKLHPRDMMIDTGVRDLQMPKEDLALLLRSIAPWIQGQRCVLDPSQSMAYCPCSDVEKMRPLRLSLDWQSFELRPKEELFQATGVQMGSGPSPEEPACRLLVSSPASLDDKTWVLGSVFLHGIATIIDVPQRKIGFAKPLASSEAVFPEGTLELGRSKAVAHLAVPSYDAQRRRLLASRLSLAVAGLLLGGAAMSLYLSCSRSTAPDASAPLKMQVRQNSYA